MNKLYIYLTSCFFGLTLISLSVGNISLNSLPLEWDVLLQTRLPRTIALILCGMSLSVAGVIMQILACNKFVEPTTTGTVEWAILGMLLSLIFLPQTPLSGQLMISVCFSLIGAGSFLWIIKNLEIRSIVMVPLIGIIYAGIIGSLVNFIAYQQDLMQFIWIWTQGDFSMILKGRYELLWIALLLTGTAYFIADRLTITGLGKGYASSLGLNYKFIFSVGIIIVASISGIVVVIAGVLPFIGLVVPNITSLLIGDNLRHSMPVIACSGAIMTITCDIIARLLIFPYEVPVGVVMGVIGSLIFLSLLNKHHQHD